MRRAFVLLWLISPATVWAECPKGTEETFNAAGVPNCISVAREAPKPPAPETCPIGSARYSDYNGQVVCRRLDTRQEFMNFTGSCPLGTFPTNDVSGNRVCQKH